MSKRHWFGAPWHQKVRQTWPLEMVQWLLPDEHPRLEVIVSMAWRHPNRRAVRSQLPLLEGNARL
jgi:hypothetical protein